MEPLGRLPGGAVELVQGDDPQIHVLQVSSVLVRYGQDLAVLVHVQAAAAAPPAGSPRRSCRRRRCLRRRRRPRRPAARRRARAGRAAPPGRCPAPPRRCAARCAPGPRRRPRTPCAVACGRSAEDPAPLREPVAALGQEQQQIAGGGQQEPQPVAAPSESPAATEYSASSGSPAGAALRNVTASASTSEADHQHPADDHQLDAVGLSGAGIAYRPTSSAPACSSVAEVLERLRAGDEPGDRLLAGEDQRQHASA